MKQALLLAGLGTCAFFGGSAAVVLGLRFEAPAFAQGPGGASASINDPLRVGERFESIARKLSPAVVYVEASKPGKPANGKATSVEESGSGVLVRSAATGQTLVITNNHVIAQAATDQITVNLADNRLFHPTRIWTDPESDVALLQVDGALLPTAPLGDSEAARVGQWVLAIGSPFGLNQTVTHGIISAKERGQVSLGTTIRIKDFLQTDAAINPGSSGGPLINMNGEVIGINTAIASHSGSNSGVAFSIPINLVKRVMAQLLEKGNVSRGYLGMELMGSFEAADALKLGLSRTQGAWVEEVFPGSPAATAGLRSNDVVLGVDDSPIRDQNHLINLISTLQAGQKIRMQVYREGKTISLEAVVGDWERNRNSLPAR
jgi:S1-C subfamily serine protease